MENYTEMAQYAYEKPNAADRPPYDSSPMGMAFSVGLWCREKGLFPSEVKASRGYSWILNRQYKLNFKDEMANPAVTSI